MGARKKERVFLFLTTILLALLFGRLFFVQQQNFTDVDKRLKDGTMVNLNAPRPAQNLASLLRKGYYFDDEKDISLIENTVAERTKAGIKFDNIGEINKLKYNVDADAAFVDGGKSFKDRVQVSRTLLGYTGDDSVRFSQERTGPPSLPTTTDLGLAGNSISGKILNKDAPVAGVLVRLQMIVPQDSIFNDEESETVKTQITTGNGFKLSYIADEKGVNHLQSITAYARTGANGEFNFTNLPENKAFNVLPLQPGFQFGRSQGTENLSRDEDFKFYQSPHSIRLISSKDFNILKKEKALIIRTPDEYNLWYWIIAGCFFASFFVIHLVLSGRFPGSRPGGIAVGYDSYRHVVYYAVEPAGPVARPFFCERFAGLPGYGICINAIAVIFQAAPFYARFGAVPDVYI